MKGARIISYMLMLMLSLFTLTGLPLASNAQVVAHRVLHRPASGSHTRTYLAISNVCTPGSGVLDGTAVVSASDVWAVGICSNNSPPYTQTLSEHWNGSSWSIVPSPNPSSSFNYLTAVAVVSTTDVWAIGDYDSNNTYQTLTEHWNGSSWSVVSSPDVGSSDNLLTGVAVVSSSDVWAVGYYLNGNGYAQTLTEHWNGSSWSVVPSPNVGSISNHLYGVAAVSTSDVWAVGDYSYAPVQTLTEHWNGTQWSVVSSPSPGSSSNGLSGARVVSTSDIWAVGGYTNSGNTSQTLTEHWNGKKWRIVKSINPGSFSNGLSGVAVVSSRDVWAVGDFSNSSRNFQTLTEHWNGKKWRVVSSPNPGSLENHITGVAVVSTSDVWAVGWYTNTNGNFQTLTEHWNGAQWSMVPSS